MKLKTLLEEIFFPKRCVSCGEYGNFICKECFSKIKLSNEIIYELKEKKLPFCFGGIIIVTNYEPPVNYLIHYLKFKAVKEISKILGNLAKKRIEQLPKILQNQFLKDSIIIPMPLSRVRRFERGFNQVELITLQIFEKSVIYPYILKRKHSKPQSKLKDKTKRFENISGKFYLKNPEKLKNKNVLLIDDVLTTGATISSAIWCLEKACPKSIWAIIIAKD